MKLDRNITTPRRGKYALIKLRIDQPVAIAHPHPDGRGMRINSKAVDFGDSEDSDFFVIRLKDKYAAAALSAYAVCAHADDPEYSKEIFELAEKAFNHPSKRKPD